MMEKSRRKKIAMWALAALAVALLIVGAVLFYYKALLPYWAKLDQHTYNNKQREKLIAYAQQHETFTLGEVLEYDWDVAYFYTDGHGTGKELKERYGLVFEIDPLGYDTRRRLLFFKQGELVSDLWFETFEFYISNDLEPIYPDTVLVRVLLENNGGDYYIPQRTAA